MLLLRAAAATDIAAHSIVRSTPCGMVVAMSVAAAALPSSVS